MYFIQLAGPPKDYTNFYRVTELLFMNSVQIEAIRNDGQMWAQGGGAKKSKRLPDLHTACGVPPPPLASTESTGLAQKDPPQKKETAAAVPLHTSIASLPEGPKPQRPDTSRRQTQKPGPSTNTSCGETGAEGPA